MSRPNFLVVVADQLRADALGAFGNERASTPNLDALAARGTRFTEAFAQHSVCAPSRTSLMTGWYPHVRGHRTLTHLLEPDEPNLLRHLKEDGYHVTHVGERGDTFAPGATERSCTEYGFAEPPTQPLLQGRVDQSDDAMARAFYAGRKPDDVVDGDEAAVRTVEGWLAAPPERPWMLYVPLIAPHCPFGSQEPWFSQHRREDMPPRRPTVSGHEPRYMDAIRRTYGTHRLTDAQWREIAASYYGMVSRLDWHVGRMLDALRDAGHTDDTVVIFLSDHGEYLGDYDLIEKWPSGLHDCLLRDPLIMAGPGIPAGEQRDALVEVLDLFPTVLDLAGVEVRHHHFGRSLLPLLADPASSHRDEVFSEGGFLTAEASQLERPSFPYDLKGQLQHDDPTLVGKAVAVRTPQWTYVWRLYEPPELYSRVDDPHEIHNLAGTPEVADVEAELRERVLRWSVETADVLPAEEHPRLPDVDLPTPGGEGRRAVPGPVTSHDHQGRGVAACRGSRWSGSPGSVPR